MAQSRPPKPYHRNNYFLDLWVVVRVGRVLLRDSLILDLCIRYVLDKTLNPKFLQQLQCLPSTLPPMCVWVHVTNVRHFEEQLKDVLCASFLKGHYLVEGKVRATGIDPMSHDHTKYPQVEVSSKTQRIYSTK